MLSIAKLAFLAEMPHIAASGSIGADMGRKPTYDPEQFKTEIIQWISDGNTLRDYCRLEGRPSYVTVYDWMAEDADFAERFARARETGHDVIADSILEIVDQHPPPNAQGSTDAGYVSWQKNRAWTRLQLLAKWNPRRYGDAKKAVELSGPDGGPLQLQATIIDGSGLSDEAAMALSEALDEALYRSTGEDDPYIDEEDQEGEDDGDSDEHLLRSGS